MPFEIPNGWEWCRINDISDSILYGVSESAKANGKYKLLRITDIQNSEVNWSSVPMTDFDESKADQYILNNNDILFARTGATVGKSYLAQNTPNNAIYASYLIRIRISHFLSPQFVKYYFESEYYWEQINVNSVGVGQPNVNGTILGSLSIPLPPRKEQERIVEIVSKMLITMDSLLSEQNLIVKSVEKTKEKILDLAIHGKLVPQDSAEEPAIESLRRFTPSFACSDNLHYEKQSLFTLPKGWEWCTVKDYSKKVTDYVASGSFASLKENVRYYKKPNYAILVKTKDFANGFSEGLTYTDERGYNFLENSRLHGGELLFSNVGSVGKIFKVPQLKTRMTLAPNAIMVKFHHDDQSAWFERVFQSPFGQDSLRTIASATAVMKFNKTDFSKLLIPVPPENEQKRILKALDDMLTQLESIQDVE